MPYVDVWQELCTYILHLPGNTAGRRVSTHIPAWHDAAFMTYSDVQYVNGPYQQLVCPVIYSIHLLVSSTQPGNPSRWSQAPT